MPWFHRKSDAERQHEAEEQEHQLAVERDRAATLESLAQGGIPVEAQRRLDGVCASGGSFFTSDLSVNEFLLARSAGMRAVSQVMGSSMYHVGWNYIGWGTPTGELTVVSEALNKARMLAVDRLRAEAERVGAHVVIGARVTRRSYDWDARMLEFNVVGTAVTLDGVPPGPPAISSLSGQEFWQLYQAGYWPLDVVGASAVYHVVPNWTTQNMNWFGMGWANQELREFTQGLYAARHLATSRIQRMGKHLHAAGVVGLEIEQEQEECEVSGGNDNERTDMIFTFHALGTAIVRRKDVAIPRVPPVGMVVDLSR